MEVVVDPVVISGVDIIYAIRSITSKGANFQQTNWSGPIPPLPSPSVEYIALAQRRVAKTVKGCHAPFYRSIVGGANILGPGPQVDKPSKSVTRGQRDARPAITFPAAQRQRPIGPVSYIIISLCYFCFR